MSSTERALSIAILALILGCLITLLRREWRPFLRGLAAFAPASLAVLTGLALAAVSKTADGLGRKLDDFGLHISRSAEELAHVIEEISELGIPLMFALAIVCCRHRRSE